MAAPSGAGRAAEGWALAEAPREFSFPRDHGAHPEFRTEWWYYTGVLRDTSQRVYGFQLTFFRVGLVPELKGRTSRWATRDVLFAHFAVTDAGAGRFSYHEKTGRPVLGLAGFSTRTLDVFIRDWSARMEGGQMRLKASSGGEALDLTLTRQRPPVPNGERGLSRKGPGRGNANYYYSIPRMATEGTLRIRGRTRRVTGTTWMDHEWGTSELAPDQKGWDWFSLRLSDGRDLMLYVLRDEKGRATSFSSGTLVEPSGSARRLGPADFRVRPLSWWTSPRSGGRYPSGWELSLPGADLALKVEPLVKDQELITSGTTGVTYWEGIVRATGRSRGKSVSGEGYVELTGYAPGSRISPGAGR